MARLRINPNLAKLYRSYTVTEVCELFGVHPNTVRNWLKQGLPAIDEYTPTMIRGAALRAFHQRKRAANKRPCAPHELYCVACGSPKEPAGGFADFEPGAETRAGRLIGLCPTCERVIHKHVSESGLIAASRRLSIQRTDGLSIAALEPSQDAKRFGAERDTGRE